MRFLNVGIPISDSTSYLVALRPPEAPLEVYPEVSVFEGSKMPNPCPDLAYLRVVWEFFA
jgi:hypothetical protein